MTTISEAQDAPKGEKVSVQGESVSVVNYGELRGVAKAELVIGLVTLEPQADGTLEGVVGGFNYTAPDGQRAPVPEHLRCQRIVLKLAARGRDTKIMMDGVHFKRATGLCLRWNGHDWAEVVLTILP